MSNRLSLAVLSSYLKERLTQPLPGSFAHEVMRAKPVDGLRMLPKSEFPPRPGGVLILLYEQDGEVYFPLIKRPDYAGAHGGQISLPGGKAEPGEDRLMTALREGEEEIGIEREKVSVIGQLSDFHVIPSNYLVTPVVARVEIVPDFKPDPFEVARIFSAKIKDLTQEDAMRQKEITIGSYSLLAPHFEIDGEIVWGATAMILSEFRHILKEIG